MNNKALWNKFECKILVNNRKLKKILIENVDLIQRNPEKSYSNLAFFYNFIAHVDEFEATRTDEEKVRQILFPEEINSLFGVEPVSEFTLPSTEALEDLITKLNQNSKFEKIANDINTYLHRSKS